MVIKYKVVENIEGSYYSSHAEGRYSIRYLPEVFVEAPVGGLLVFDTFKQASEILPPRDRMIRVNRMMEVWKVEVEQPVKLPEHAFINTGIYPVGLRLFERLWGGEIIDDWGMVPWPEGTEAYKYVKLIEQEKGEKVSDAGNTI